MQNFLLIYDHNEQQLQDERIFAENESDEATAAYQDAERQHWNDANIEVVLIGAESPEIVQRTHGHYFTAQDRLSRYLQPS